MTDLSYPTRQLILLAIEFDHLWGGDPLSWREWAGRLHPTLSSDSAERRWFRFWQRLAKLGIEFETIPSGPVPTMLDPWRRRLTRSGRARVWALAEELDEWLLSKGAA